MEDLNFPGNVIFKFVEDPDLEVTKCRPRTAGSVPVGRGPETPVKGDRLTAASLRDLYPMESRSIAALRDSLRSVVDPGRSPRSETGSASRTFDTCSCRPKPSGVSLGGVLVEAQVHVHR